jgi:hypothetical protein
MKKIVKLVISYHKELSVEQYNEDEKWLERIMAEEDMQALGEYFMDQGPANVELLVEAVEMLVEDKP